MQKESHSPYVANYIGREIPSTLDELADIARQRPLLRFERLAAERCLQITIDTAISTSILCCKKAGKTHSGDAYKNLLTAHDLLNSNIPHAALKGAAGMRNAIVHDYLNLDWARIEAVIVNQQYQTLGDFIEAGLTYLSN